jgi:hypothetical protein
MISCVPSIRSAISGPAHASYDGYCTSYDVLQADEPKSETQHLRSSQQHTATSHMNSTSTLVAKFLRQTSASETFVNHVKTVKLTVFGLRDGAPILAEDYPIYTAMAKPLKGACSTLYFIQIMSLTPNMCWSGRFHQLFAKPVLTASPPQTIQGLPCFRS